MKRRTKKDDRFDVLSIEKAIEIIGGAEKLARKLEVSYQTVLNWKNGFTVPTSLNCVKIEKATEGKVKKENILPDYPWEDFK